MKKYWMILLVVLLQSCKNAPAQPPAANPVILAYVHWDEVPSVGIKVELVQTGETKFTDSTGHAAFSVAPGKYVVRVYGINRGGPALRSFDFTVESMSTDTTAIDVVNCLPCM
jgi:hypothetical protein